MEAIITATPIDWVMLNEITTWNVKNVLEDCKKLIILFRTDACNKCHMRMKDIEKNLEYLEEDWILFYTYNAWEDIDLCNELNITTVPVLIYFKDWVEVWRLNEVSPFESVYNLYKE